MKISGASVLSSGIRQRAKNEGIDILRVAHADPFAGYLLPHSPRQDPHRTLSRAHALILAGIYIGGFTFPEWDNPTIGRTSHLFLSGFFCSVVEPLKSIASFLREQGFSAVICDDFQPHGSILPLKLTAVRAGVGWQGKNTLLISPDYGSFLALGGIITDTPLEADEGMEKDRCGKCRACQEACPTNALDEPYRLNRKRCLSHLLSEESLPQEAYQFTGNKVLDCEVCQLVCPWNKKHLEEPLVSERTRIFRQKSTPLKRLFKLSNLARMTEAGYREFVGPYRTTVPYRVFRRNVIAALGHSKDHGVIPLVQSALEEDDPEIQGFAKMSMNSLQQLIS
jgi:epoxyqueuosine reductase